MISEPKKVLFPWGSGGGSYPENSMAPKRKSSEMIKPWRHAEEVPSELMKFLGDWHQAG